MMVTVFAVVAGPFGKVAMISCAPQWALGCHSLLSGIARETVFHPARARLSSENKAMMPGAWDAI